MKFGKSSVAMLLALVVGTSMANAQSTVYWDINGSDPGAGNVGGFTDGVWGTDSFWNPMADGTGATGAWVVGDNAVFSAGSDAVDSFININGTQVANSILVEEGTVFFASGIADVGAGTITVNAGATLRINTISRLTNIAGSKLVLNGGTLFQSNPGNAGSFLNALKTLEIDGTGVVNYTSLNDDNTPGVGLVSIYSGVITGTGGTTTNGGAGTLIKRGPNQLGIGVSNVGGVHSQSLFTFAKLVVEEGAYRLRHQTLDNTVKETAFGAVPLAELADAITLNGGGIGTNTTVTLHAFRGVTIGPNGGYLDNGAGGGMSIPGPVSGSGTLTIGGPSGAVTFTLSNTNNVNTFTGKLNIERGVLSVPAASALGAAPGSPLADSITIGAVSPAASTGTLTFTETTTLDANRGITLAGEGRINIPTGGNTLTYDGVITGPGKFIKMGDGLLTTTSAHTYDGGTDVYGRLVVNNASGSGTGSGAVTVKTASALGTNGTLGGTGSVAGLITVESAGSISPGAVGIDIGTLTAAGGITLGAGSVLRFDLGAPGTSDVINASGVTTIDGGSVVLTDAGGLAAGNYTLIDYAGTLGGSVANLGTPTGPAAFNYALVDTGSTVDLTVSAISAALIGDYNNDGTVNAADYTVWRDNVGAATLPDNRDPANVGVVGQDDYDSWVENFGDTAGSGAGAAVPEPSTIGLALFSLLAMLSVTRKRR